MGNTGPQIYFTLADKYPDLHEEVNQEKIPLIYRYILENDLDKARQFLVDFTNRATPEDLDYLYFSGYSQQFVYEEYSSGLYDLVVDNGLLEAALLLIDFYPDQEKIEIFDHSIVMPTTQLKFLLDSLDLKVTKQIPVKYHEEIWYPMLAKIDRLGKSEAITEMTNFPGTRLDKCISSVYQYGYLIAKYSSHAEPNNLHNAYLLLKKMEYQHLVEISKEPEINGQLVNDCLSIVTQQTFQLYNYI